MTEKTTPPEADIKAEAWNAIDLLRAACPLEYTIRDIIIVSKIPGAIAQLQPFPDADGGPTADIVISRQRLGRDWKRVVQTRIAHEWMELALYSIRYQAGQLYCDSVMKTIDGLCERASVVMESMMKFVLTIKS